MALQPISPNQRESISAIDQVTGSQFYITGDAVTGAINVGLKVDTIVVSNNITQIGGVAISLGQKTMTSSLPIAIASDQTSIPVVATQSGTWATNATQVGGTSISVSSGAFDNGTQRVATAIPSAIVAFVTAVTTAGTRVQLASNTLTNGAILQAPSTNTGVIYVGGSTVSATVYGAQLQPGQATSFAGTNSNLIYIDSSVNGDKCALLGG